MNAFQQDIGAGKGKYYAVNFPLRDGIDDESYEQIFVPIMSKVMETYQPSAVVLQCGADSLSGDRLGCFNLTLKGRPVNRQPRDGFSSVPLIQVTPSASSSSKSTTCPSSCSAVAATRFATWPDAGRTRLPLP